MFAEALSGFIVARNSPNLMPKHCPRFVSMKSADLSLLHSMSRPTANRVCVDCTEGDEITKTVEQKGKENKRKRERETKTERDRRQTEREGREKET